MLTAPRNPVTFPDDFPILLAVYHQRAYLRLRRCDILVPLGPCIPGSIKTNTQEFKSSASALAERSAVLADAPRKDHRIETAKTRDHLPHSAAQPMRVNIEGQYCSAVPRRNSVND